MAVGQKDIHVVEDETYFAVLVFDELLHSSLHDLPATSWLQMSPAGKSSQYSMLRTCSLVEASKTLIHFKAVDADERLIGFACSGSEVSIWDLEKAERVYNAKGPKPDRTGLTEKPDNSAICFLPGTASTNVLVGTVSRRLRLYETSQRRPKLVVDFGEGKITSIAPEAQGKTNLASKESSVGKLVSGQIHILCIV